MSFKLPGIDSLDAKVIETLQKSEAKIQNCMNNLFDYLHKAFQQQSVPFAQKFKIPPDDYAIYQAWKRFLKVAKSDLYKGRYVITIQEPSVYNDYIATVIFEKGPNFINQPLIGPEIDPPRPPCVPGFDPQPPAYDEINNNDVSYSCDWSSVRPACCIIQ